MAKKKSRSDGRYVVTFSLNGKRYYSYGSTQKEAREKSEKKKQELKEGKYIRSENLTVDQYYMRYSDAKRGTVKPSTLRNQHNWYKAVSNTVIDGAGTTFGSLKLKEVERQNVVDLQKNMEKAELIDGSPKYNSTTINSAIYLVKSLFNAAIDDEILIKNPAQSVKALKKKEIKARDSIHRALTKAETRLFFEGAEESYYYNVFQFMLSSGCRCGEAGALSYSDIKRKEGKLEIRRSITRTEEGFHVVGDSPKTAQGKRDIPLTSGIMDAITRQHKTEEEYGIAYRMDGLIFTSPEGSLLNDTAVNREIARICKKVGVDRFTAHAFRATFATRAVESGMNFKTLQEIMGHSDISVTMNLYAHCLDETKIKEMNAINIAL